MNRPPKRGGSVRRRPVHGVLLLDKPLGFSSTQALAKAKWLLRAEKGGHTGTLDPLATGVLPLCFGAATKFSQIHLDADKSYEATLRLGQTTTTGDAEGEVQQERAVGSWTDAELDAVAAKFTGWIEQIPPMYSALKQEGKPLYEYARAGLTRERAARRVCIHHLALARAASSNALYLRVRCSKGTYVRTLAEDIGEALGCGAHLTALRRTATGEFSLAPCVSLETLEATPEDERIGLLHPTDILLPQDGAVSLSADEAGRFLTGLRRRGPWPNADLVAVWGEQPRALLGSAHIQAGELIPTRLLSPLEIEQTLVQSAGAQKLNLED
jgi:tRNA pseudouridine55 synthase